MFLSHNYRAHFFRLAYLSLDFLMSIYIIPNTLIAKLLNFITNYTVPKLLLILTHTTYVYYINRSLLSFVKVS